MPADETNLAWRRGPAARRARRPGSRRRARPAQGHPGGRRAWPAAAPTRRPRWWPATRCGSSTCPATSCPALAAELGSDVTFALHGGTALGTGPRRADRRRCCPRHAQHWVIALHRDRAVHARGVRRARPAPRRRAPAPPARPSSRCWRPSRAATRASSPCRSATTCSRAAISLAPSCAAPCGRASTRARSPGIVSGIRARRARSCARARSRARRRRRAGGRGRLPHGPGGARPGAGCPRRRGSGARPRWPRRCAPDGQPGQPGDSHPTSTATLAGAARRRVARRRRRATGSASSGCNGGGKTTLLDSSPAASRRTPAG